MVREDYDDRYDGEAASSPTADQASTPATVPRSSSMNAPMNSIEDVSRKPYGMAKAKCGRHKAIAMESLEAEGGGVTWSASAKN